MTKLYWKVRIFFLALRWILQINLGDLVWYQGNQFTVCNGTRYKSWRLDLNNNDDGWVPRSECKKVWTWNNIKHSFQSGYNFYMTSWFDIWCRTGILPWMKVCNIWPKSDLSDLNNLKKAVKNLWRETLKAFGLKI